MRRKRISLKKPKAIVEENLNNTLYLRKLWSVILNIKDLFLEILILRNNPSARVTKRTKLSNTNQDLY